jgi:hypothetical protein
MAFEKSKKLIWQKTFADANAKDLDTMVNNFKEEMGTKVIATQTNQAFDGKLLVFVATIFFEAD